jgi:PAS domain-containing protein
MSNFMPTPTVAHPRKSGFSILLVDTLGKGVSELKEHLEQEGNQADAATNAFEMLEKIKTKAYDAVIFNTELVQKEDARLVETLTTRIPQFLMYENEDVIQVCDRTLEAIEEKRAIDELKVNEEKLQAMIEYAKDGIILFDEAGKITFWNRAAEQIFSYTAQEAIGKSIHILVPPERAKVFDEGRKRVFENVKAKGGKRVSKQSCRNT